MKRNMLIIISLMLLATGCANKNTVPAESTVQNIANDDIADTAYSLSEINTEIYETQVSKDEIDTTIENYAQLPTYVYSGNDGIEKAITEFFQEADLYFRPKGSVMIPAFCIFREESTDDDFPVQNDVKVYGNFWMFIYSKHERTLFCESGGENPCALYLRKTGENSYEVTRMDRAADGSQYSEDIKRICNGNASLEKQFYESADANSAAVKNIRTWNIYKYVKDNNLDIQYYQDYGWDPVDFKMEVNSWGNVILDTEDDSKEAILSGEPRKYSPFASSEMHDLKLATLFVDGKEYSITNAESLKWIEDSFSRADELKGWPNCPYDAELILVRTDGASFKVEVATDSCNNIKDGDIWYIFHSDTGDNTPLYDSFGIKVLFGKVIE